MIMTQEDKELLLKDLCARLPYGVCYKHFTWDDERGEECIAVKIYSINSDGYVKNCYDDETVYIDNVHPYLFPMSSMTDDQCCDFYCRFVENEIDYNDFKKYYFDSCSWNKVLTLISDCGDVINWFIKNHFDYRGLIEKGLAIDATGLNIY